MAFYRRRPSALQISLGLVLTIVLSGLIGYLQDRGTSRVWENVIVAAVGGTVLYVAILVFLLYYYLPRRDLAQAATKLAPPAAPPP